MSKPDFIEQFQAIGYSMAKKAKKEVQEINRLREKRVKDINAEFTRDFMHDLREKTEFFLRNYETQLNQQISENIKDLNLKILTKKNAMFEDYKESLIKRVQQYIEENYDSYIQNMIKIVKSNLKIFKSTVYIQLNQRDNNSFNKIQSEFDKKKLLLETTSLNRIGGFKLTNRANTVVISNTIEDSIEKCLYRLRMKFTKIFPEYVDRRNSATQLMKERNITISSSLPEELEEFMLANDIEFLERDE